ncbi:dual specificity protein phosphatase 16-like [Carassius carassius]|uniref:dual specificity protein phosphatase 16-like n=1 Tax=Carassius carassius TaxID=217509 RepID=UPI002868C76E|nr:dual specificity protein phosphatase 16-like [Carassius carassius]
MVYCRDSQSERPALSRILPHLYLGAETDVTQDALSDRGISYVLNVSRCCPQPSFLPQSQYLRIPIDDSLRDDLLHWIPQALHFIDGAMSCGCSVLVHCAAGISRSPALAVAYVMYRLKMDLDHAYRFVKERRPTISPNFNFLGQLQLFQGTLSLKKNNTNLNAQQSVKPLDNCLQPTNEKNNSSSNVALLTNLNLHNNMDNNCIINGCTEDSEENGHCENKNNQMETIQSRGQCCEVMNPEFTLSLSDKLGALTLRTNPIDLHRAVNVTSKTQQDAPKSNLPKPTNLQIPSLAEKRKSLTLSLTPVSAVPQTHRKGSSENSYDLRQSSSTVDQTGALDDLGRVQMEPSESRTEPTEANGFISQDPRTPRANMEQQKTNQVSHSSRRSQRQTQGPRGVITSPQLFGKEVIGGVEAVEGMVGDQSPLSPVSLTVNKILDWGERMLLGVILGPRVKLGQAALPYRC